MKRIGIGRLRILYLLLVILVSVSVAPLWFYGSKMASRNREILERQENILQATISKSLAREIGLFMENAEQRLGEFFDEVSIMALRMLMTRGSLRSMSSDLCELHRTPMPESIALSASDISLVSCFFLSCRTTF